VQSACNAAADECEIGAPHGARQRSRAAHAIVFGAGCGPNWKKRGVGIEPLRFDAPEYDEFGPITREYENRLYFHYGRPPYWLHDAEHRSSYSLSGV
jgi:hypothetical protein